ncbi:spore germination protein KC [Shouchella clausii]|uniref:Ger(x)C family spore germination protein n=1 Tax=Shouchella tritolerans TaxID=2979466 RepID=UPI000786A2F5|nr:Ger(x)C family spore germination protein [Shouchella tritolerans]GIN13706.1 spore germination protein KC [Shouchella clausii]
MQAKIQKTMIIVVSFFLLSGCWDRWELNQLSLIVGIAVDKEGDDYVLTMQAMNPAEIASQETGRGYAQGIDVREKSKTIHESLRKMIQKNPRRSFVSQLKVLILSEDVAKDGLDHVLDFFYRDHEMRSDFFVLIAKDTPAENILNVLTPLENLSAQSLFDSIEFSGRSYSSTKKLTMDRLFYDIKAEGIEPSIMGVTVSGDLQQGRTKKNVEQNMAAAFVETNGLAIFKGSKMITWLSQQNSKNIEYLNSGIENSVKSFTCPGGGKIALEIHSIEPALKMELIDGAPSVTYDLSLEATISEVDCVDLDLSVTSSYEQVEKQAQTEMETNIHEAIVATQQAGSDILGIGQELYRKFPDYWEEVRDDWYAIYQDLDVKMNIDITISDSGSIVNSFSKGDH